MTTTVLNQIAVTGDALVTLNTSARTGAKFYIAIGPVLQCDYNPQEPFGTTNSSNGNSTVPINTDIIRGLSKGVPRLGGGVWIAFVGESTDFTQFDTAYNSATMAGNQLDWGDGTTSASAPFTFTHTYAAVGLYIVKVKRISDGAALATRPVRVLFRTRPPNNSDGSPGFGAFDISYPITVKEPSTGTITNTYALRVQLMVNDMGYPLANIGLLPEFTMVGIFAEVQQDTGPGGTYGNYGKLGMVMGGFLHAPTIVPDDGATTLQFDILGISSLFQQMPIRAMDFTDPGLTSQAQMLNANYLVNGRSPIFGDPFGLGFVAAHKNLVLTPPQVVVHLLEHVRCYYTDGNGANPASLGPSYVMPGGTKSYALLSQVYTVDLPNDFDQFRTDSHYVFYSILDGFLLDTINSELAKEGWFWTDRHGLTSKIGRKPWYEVAAVTPALAIGDMSLLKVAPKISRGQQNFVSEVQVEKALFTIQTPGGSNNAVTTNGGQSLDARRPYDSYAANGGAASNATANAAYNAAVAAGTFPALVGSGSALDALTYGTTLDSYFYRYPSPPNLVGRVVSVGRVYTSDPQKFAIGTYNMQVCSWSIEIELGQMLGIGVTDYITLTTGTNFKGASNLGISGWNKKLFWIMAIRTTFGKAGFSLRATAVEVNAFSNS